MIFPSACSQEETADISQPQAPVRQAPAVKTQRQVDASILKDIGQLRGFQNARIDQVYDVNQATVAEYENLEGFEFVFMPLASDPNRVNVFVYAFGVLEDNFQVDFVNKGNSMEVETDNGKIIYDIETTPEGQFITGMEIDRDFPVDLDIPIDISNGRIARINDVFQGYLDCMDAVTDQAAAIICGGCGFGKVAFGVACGYWAVCNGAWNAGCIAMAITLSHLHKDLPDDLRYREFEDFKSRHIGLSLHFNELLFQ